MKWLIPQIKNFAPDFDLAEIMAVQPLADPISNSTFKFSEFKHIELPSSPFWQMYTHSTDEPFSYVTGEKSIIYGSWLKNVWTATNEHFVEDVEDQINRFCVNQPGWTNLTLEVIKAREKLNKFITHRLPEYKLFEFSSSQSDWTSLCGRGGWVIMSDNQVVSVYITRMS